MLTVIFVVLALLITFLYRNNTPNNTLLESLAIGFLGSTFLELIVGVCGQRKMINQRRRDRTKTISDTVSARLAEIDNQNEK